MDPTLETRRLSDLVPFPRNSLFFPDMSDRELQDLARDIVQIVRDRPIEILPDNSAGFMPNTIIRGHQRLRALRLVGAKTTVVRVRYDLADANELTIKKDVFNENIHRRHMDPVSRARAIDEFVTQRKLDRDPDFSGPGQVRDRLGGIFHLSGRQVARYLTVLKTPVAIQDAVRDGKLPMVRAVDVASLDSKTQQQLAKRIEKGEDPREVVCGYLDKQRKRRPESSQDPDALGNEVRALADSFTAASRGLTDRLDQIKWFHIFGHAQELRDAHDLTVKLLQICETIPGKPQAENAACVDQPEQQ